MSCPPEEELMPLAADEPAPEDVAGHVQGCPDCTVRLNRLKTACRNIRLLVSAEPQFSGPDVTVPCPPKQSGSVADLPATDSGAAPAQLDIDQGLPQKIGKYVVIAALDHGGQARLFRAVHPALEKEMVIKLANYSVRRDSSEYQRLIKEGRILAELEQHPNLARVYDLDFHDGRPFLAMERLSGQNLANYAKWHRFTARQAASVVAKLARAMAMVHVRGITHRDLKPANVVLDDGGEPRIVDFGIAHRQAAWSGQSDASEELSGTIGFLPPETACGKDDPAAPQGDIFAQGAMLYFLLTNLTPFHGSTATEALKRSQNCDFDRAALRRARVPRVLERTVLRAMSADPAERHGSALALAAELDRFVRRPQRLALAAAGAFVIIGLTLGAWIVLSGRNGGGASAGPATAQFTPDKQPRATVNEAISSSFVIEHYRLGKDEQDLIHVGHLGESMPRQHDRVVVKAEFAEPLYPYLLAVNVDGTCQPLFPRDDEAALPSAVQQFVCPIDGSFFTLDDAGLVTFVLIAAREPLPGWKQWLSPPGPDGWRELRVDSAWQFDGQRLEPLSKERDVGTARHGPEPLAEFCRKLKAQTGAAVVRAVTFPVAPT